MADFPFLPMYTDAFVADTTHLSAQETGAYLLLLFAAWRAPDCSLPDDDVWLSRTARVETRAWAKIKNAVLAFWTLHDGRWAQKRLTKTREIAGRKAQVARENGKRGGRPKSLDNQEPQSCVGSARVSKTEATKARTKSKVVSYPALQACPPDAFPPATSMDPRWEADQNFIDAAIAEGVPSDRVLREGRQFRDHHLDRGSVSHDWMAAWRRWCRMYRPEKPPRRPPRGEGAFEPAPTGLAAHLIALEKRMLTEPAHGCGPDDHAAAVPLLAGPLHPGKGRGVA